jgi:hypothetical protein
MKEQNGTTTLSGVLQYFCLGRQNSSHKQFDKNITKLIYTRQKRETWQDPETDENSNAVNTRISQRACKTNSSSWQEKKPV